MEEESIYNLIPREYVPPPKPARYRSKYPPNTVPSASTFGLHTTSKILNNVEGNYDHFVGAHDHRGLQNTLGKVKGSAMARPTEFRKKQTGTMVLPQVTNFERQSEKRCPPVPKRHEQPIHGLRSEKNYITANAVDNILRAPVVQPEPQNMLAKKTYGKTPNYLHKIKGEIEEEYEMLRQLHREQEEEQERQRYLLSYEEAKELRNGLRKKWEAVNKEFQTITHISKIDTQGLKRKKEGCAAELAQLEKDIELLDKQYVFVDTNY